MLGYKFPTLDDDQLALRRETLGFYGAIAQWSFVLSALSVQACLLGRWVFRQMNTRDDLAAGKAIPNHSQRGRSRWIQKSDYLFLWLSERRYSDGLTNGECALGTLWGAWLLFLCVHNTGDDFLHLTKRFGIIGMSQLPMHYALGRRSTSAALQFVTRLPHEALLGLHRLLGRIILSLFALHATCYMFFFASTGVLHARMLAGPVLAGEASLAILLTLAVTSIARARKWNYRLFYTTHVLATSAFLPVLLFFHTSQIGTRILCAETLAVRAVEEVARRARTRTFPATLANIPGTTLVRVHIPLPLAADARRGDGGAMKAGQHVLLSRPAIASAAAVSIMTARLRANPFTVVPLRSLSAQNEGEDGLVLVCRAPTSAKGNTARLSAVARMLSMASTNTIPSTSPEKSSTPGRGSAPTRAPPPHLCVTIEGPYEASSSLPSPTELLDTYNGILVVAGGVGATFSLPVFRSIQAVAASRSPGCGEQKRVRFVWAVRHLAEAEWAFSFSPSSNQNERGEANSATPASTVDVKSDEVALYVTGQGINATTPGASLLGGSGGDYDEDVELGELVGSHRGQAAQQRLHMQEFGRSLDAGILLRGRPDLGAILDQTCDDAGAGGVAVLVCGPRSMVRELRAYVERTRSTQRKIFWHAESFS